ncbi:MAG: hypothetical protein R6X25_13970 [Candidatus Krumholzibacteriia bacterium]
MLNAEQGEGKELAPEYRVRVLPTFVMLNEDGEEVDRWFGYGEDGAEEWVAAMEEARDDLRPVAAKREAYEREPTLALVRALARQALYEDPAAAVGHLRTALELTDDAEQAADYQRELFGALTRAAASGQASMDEVRAQADRLVTAPDSDTETLVDVTIALGRLALQTGEPAVVVPYLKQAVERTEGTEDEDLQAFRTQAMPDYALFVENDPARAVALKRETLGEAWQESPDKLNEFAWWSFQRRVQLEEAERLAMKGAELAADDGTRANLLDTAAEIAAVRGNLDRAVELAERAAELAPERAFFKRQVEKFRGMKEEEPAGGEKAEGKGAKG